MDEFKSYKRSGHAEMRPYIPGEDLSGVSVSGEDTPSEGGMIARNPANHADQWYVAAAYFKKNFELLVLCISLLSLSACADVSVKRERGATVNGYTTYTTVLTVVDEPVCAGSCQP